MFFVPLCPLWLVVAWSLAEDRGAEADAGGAFFDGDFEIVRHAHGERIEADGGKIAAGNVVADFAQAAEKGTRAFRVVR